MSDLYPIEQFTPAQERLLLPHFTNLDSPVFALTNLPETVKGALFARYSRYQGTLRQLYLEEFAGDATSSHDLNDEGQRASDIYERVFLGYGDDSVAQLGGVHVACEWSSNILTKILQRPRIGAYLEQSTRYIAFNQPMAGTGRFRYYRSPELGPEYERAMDSLFVTYGNLIERMEAWAAERFPCPDGESEAAWRRSVHAKALDSCRGLLPAASLSHMGIYASGQTYEQLVLHLLAHPLPEAQQYGRMLLDALKQVIPSFLSRVERPDRGGRWVEYLRQRTDTSRGAADILGLTGATNSSRDQGPSVTLRHVDGDEAGLLTALLFEQSNASEAEIDDAVRNWNDASSREPVLAALLGNRENRRHRPGRGLEALRYRFEIVSDYGAFRDLQRHRMLTAQWQQLSPYLGSEVPEDIDTAGCGDDFRRALEVSATEYERLREQVSPDVAPYALCLAYRIRYILDMNAREAMQLIELRSGKEGHPSYRAVALEMHRLIGEVHPMVAEAMTHVDRTTDPRLERISSELRNEAKAAAARDEFRPLG